MSMRIDAYSSEFGFPLLDAARSCASTPPNENTR